MMISWQKKCINRPSYCSKGEGLIFQYLQLYLISYQPFILSLTWTRSQNTPQPFRLTTIYWSPRWQLKNALRSFYTFRHQLIINELVWMILNSQSILISNLIGFCPLLPCSGCLFGRGERREWSLFFIFIFVVLRTVIASGWVGIRDGSFSLVFKSGLAWLRHICVWGVWLSRCFWG